MNKRSFITVITRMYSCSTCVIVVLAVGVLLLFPFAVVGGPISPGDDVWSTPCGGGAYVDFSGNPIPANFFGPGSDPFTGNIQLGGLPIPIVPPLVPGAGHVDTVVRRGGTTPGFTCGSPPETVPIEILSLSLTSCSPIIISFDGGTSTQIWNVRVCLSGPQTAGTMTISHECVAGGSYTSSLPVTAGIVFTRTSPPGGPLTITQTVTMVSSGQWSHTDPGLGLYRFSPGQMFDNGQCLGPMPIPTINPPGPADFFPGMELIPCIDCVTPTNVIRKRQLTPEEAMLAAHGVLPANHEKQTGPSAPPVVTEACCKPPNICQNIPPTQCLAEGGIPAGVGTNCANFTCPNTGIPTMSGWGVIVLGVAVVAAAIVVIQRRRQAPV